MGTWLIRVTTYRYIYLLSVIRSTLTNGTHYPLSTSVSTGPTECLNSFDRTMQSGAGWMAAVTSPHRHFLRRCCLFSCRVFRKRLWNITHMCVPSLCSPPWTSYTDGMKSGERQDRVVFIRAQLLSVKCVWSCVFQFATHSLKEVSPGGIKPTLT